MGLRRQKRGSMYRQGQILKELQVRCWISSSNQTINHTHKQTLETHNATSAYMWHLAGPYLWATCSVTNCRWRLHTFAVKTSPHQLTRNPLASLRALQTCYSSTKLHFKPTHIHWQYIEFSFTCIAMRCTYNPNSYHLRIPLHPAQFCNTLHPHQPLPHSYLPAAWFKLTKL